jgi:hypothetical protein
MAGLVAFLISDLTISFILAYLFKKRYPKSNTLFFFHCIFHRIYYFLLRPREHEQIKKPGT